MNGGFNVYFCTNLIQMAECLFQFHQEKGIHGLFWLAPSKREVRPLQKPSEGSGDVPAPVRHAHPVGIVKCIYIIPHISYWLAVTCVCGSIVMYSVSKKTNKTRYRDSILNLSKSKRKIIKLLSVDDDIFIFLSYMVHWSFILGQGWLLSNHICKACQNCLRPSIVIVIVHKAVLDGLIVALLWKLPQMPSCSTNNASLDKPILTCFTNWLLCSHLWPNMNE